MQKRPLSLTIIGWWLAIAAVFGIYGLLTIQSNAVAMRMIEQMGTSLAVHRTVGVVGIIVSAACAYGVLKGLPWARVLYAVWGAVSLAFSISIMPIVSVIILGVLFYAVIVYFLFRPAANEWFAARGLQLHRSA